MRCVSSFVSRVGKKPIELPKEVRVSVKAHEVLVEGPRGSLRRRVDSSISVDVEAGQVRVRRSTDQRQQKALHGLYRTLLYNMVQGVNTGYTKRLEMTGVGYRAAVEGRVLVLTLGYSHPIHFALPAEVQVKAETTKGKGSGVSLSLESIDKELLGKVAAKIRSLRKVEPYQGKGIRYADEVVRRKAGKTAKKA